MGIKILIVDDHGMLRESLNFMLSREPGMEVIGEAGDGRSALELVEKLRPDVVIMDIEMPKLNGIEATRQILHKHPNTKIIASSAYSNRRNVGEMLKAGASGYVPKQCGFDELVSAIREVTSNRIYLSSRISGLVVEGYIHKQTDNDSSAYSILTAREREVLQLIAEGKSTKEIATSLYISVKTIEWHRSQIMKKLKIKSIAGLVKYAVSEGLTCAHA